jgi:uncharacterized membrane protein (UPF0127 family)
VPTSESAPDLGTAARPTVTSPAPATDASSPPPSGTAPSTTSGGIDIGDVVGFDVIEVILGGEPVTLALADESALRSRGLMGVTDLGALDGMLFSWGGEFVNSRFTMRNTLIPLHIVFFDADGVFVSQTDMAPCDVEDCPNYGAAGPYAYAIEFPAGTAVSAGDRLELDLPR